MFVFNQPVFRKLQPNPLPSRDAAEKPRFVWVGRNLSRLSSPTHKLHQGFKTFIFLAVRRACVNKNVHHSTCLVIKSFLSLAVFAIRQKGETFSKGKLHSLKIGDVFRVVVAWFWGILMEYLGFSKYFCYF